MQLNIVRISHLRRCLYLLLVVGMKWVRGQRESSKVTLLCSYDLQDAILSTMGDTKWEDEQGGAWVAQVVLENWSCSYFFLSKILFIYLFI